MTIFTRLNSCWLSHFCLKPCTLGMLSNKLFLLVFTWSPFKHNLAYKKSNFPCLVFLVGLIKVLFKFLLSPTFRCYQ